MHRVVFLFLLTIAGSAVAAPDMAVTSITRPAASSYPGMVQPAATIANLGDSYDSTALFFRIERPGGGVSESFSDTLNFPPAGWTRANPDGGLSQWVVGTTGTNTPPGSAVCTREATLLPNDDWLITPKVRVRPNDTLTFWYRSMGIYPESIEVWVSYTDSAPLSFVDAIQAFDFTNQTWQVARALFTGIGDTTCYIGFHYGMRAGLAGTGIYLDDINLRSVFYSESTRVRVAPGGTAEVAFTAWNAKLGHYAVRCSAYQAGDVQPPNDVITMGIAVVPAPPPPVNWHELTPVPAAPSGVAVKDGGSLATMAGNGLIYAIKGNKSSDFYSYDPASGVWTTLLPVPVDDRGKLVKYGASIVTDDERYVYLVKGNNTLEFYRYDVSSMEWTRLPDVPAGPLGKRVKAGDAVLVPGAGTDYIYLLKGQVGEFYRYSTADSIWQTKVMAPNAYATKWNKGSFLVYDGANTIYAHKSNYHEFWAFDMPADIWRPTALAGMPRLNGRGQSKKSKDGACGTWYDGNIYAFKGGNTQEFWRYEAAANFWTELDTLPQFGTTFKRRRVKAGADLVNLDRIIYAFKGNKTREFWTYALSTTDALPAPEPGREGAASERTAIGDLRLAIGPNPIAGGFAAVRCNLPVGTSARLQVLDAAGRVVRKTAICNPQSAIALDLRRLRAGVYIVELSGSGRSTSQKLVIQQ